MRHVRCSAAVGLAVTALLLSVSGRGSQMPNTSSALSAADSMKTFHMPPGYRVELVASEPMIVDPVVIDFDPDGRMWVVEMLGFMPDRSGTDSREPIGRVISKVTSDVSALNEILTQGLVTTVADAFMLVGNLSPIHIRSNWRSPQTR